jgi:hypothetical protein
MMVSCDGTRLHSVQHQLPQGASADWQRGRGYRVRPPGSISTRAPVLGSSAPRRLGRRGPSPGPRHPSAVSGAATGCSSCPEPSEEPSLEPPGAARAHEAALARDVAADREPVGEYCAALGDSGGSRSLSGASSSRLSRRPGRELVAACARGVHLSQQQQCAQPVRRLGSPLSPNVTVLPSAPIGASALVRRARPIPPGCSASIATPRAVARCKPAACTQQDSRDPDGPHRFDRPLARQASPGVPAPGRREAQPGHREGRPGTTFGRKGPVQAGSDDPRSCSASGRTSSSPPPSRTTSPTRTGTDDAACRQPREPVASGTMI